MPSSEAVIFICGPTGSGKTSVSIKLAQELDGEVINADVYQSYKGLDIATAKITAEEMRGISHHLLSQHDPKHHINVVDFVRNAVQAIEEVQQNGHIPIICGGSNFYVESLLFTTPTITSSTVISTTNAANDFSELSSSEMYIRLKSLDPAAASIIHPKDSRRVLRALERAVANSSVKLAATTTITSDDNESTTETLSSSSDHQLGYRLRYPHTLVVHISCRDQQAHVSRLNSRVDEMMAQGLVDEARLLFRYLHSEFSVWENFLESNAKNTNHEDHDSFSKDTKIEFRNGRGDASAYNKGGVAEAIGFKELLPYFENEVSMSSTRRQNEVRELLLKAASDIQHSTVQYAKRQATWLRNRLVPQCKAGRVPVFDFYPEDRCDTDIGSMASLLAFILASCHCDTDEKCAPSTATTLDTTPTLSCPHNLCEGSSTVQGAKLDRMTLKRKIFQCDTCNNQVFQGKDQFDIHLKSKKHRKRVSSSRKRRERESQDG